MTKRSVLSRSGFAVGIAVLVLLSGTPPLRAIAATDTDPTRAAELWRLNTVKLNMNLACAKAQEARSRHDALETGFWRWFGARLTTHANAWIDPKTLENFNAKSLESDLLADMLPALDKVCRDARTAYRQALSEVILTRWIEGPQPQTQNPATPPPVPQSTASDQQCNDLLKRAALASVGHHFKGLADALGNRAGNPKADARTSYRKALALYHEGAERCKHGRYPALFAKRIRETESQLRKAGGTP